MEASRNNSKKRNAIYEALCGTKEHPTAEMLCTMVRNDIPELSLGTVYRNLALLESDGLVKNIGEVNGHSRYDARMDRHSHFICRKCGSVTDIDLPERVSELYADIEEKYGAIPEEYSLTFRGVCSKCAATEKQSFLH